MKTLTKILLTLSVSLFFVGVVMCGLAYIVGGGDLSRMDFETAYEEKEFTPDSGLITNIKINSDRHDIIIKESASVANVTIKYYENQYDKFVINNIENNSVYITNKGSENAFIRFFCLLFDSKNKDEKTVSITVPQNYSGTIEIECSDADISVDNLNNAEKLNISSSNGDIILNTLNCTNAVLNVKTGNISVLGGTYEVLDITAANPVQYLPIDEVDPELWPSGIIVPSTPTPSPSETPNITFSPIETPASDDDAYSDDSDDTDETPLVTPTPSATPAATKTPTILVVEASVTFEKVDVQQLTLNTVYTNIIGSLERGEGYYKITTNNENSSNIKTNENISAVGSITISQKEGKTELEFK